MKIQIPYGWRKKWLRSWAVSPGNRSSSEEGGGSDATDDDPQALHPEVLGPPLDIVELTVEQRRGVRVLVVGIYLLASRLTDKDKVVVFGRDCYPILGMLAYDPILPGEWMYAEGVSRVISKHVSIPGMTVGVDTGFAGTIPHQCAPGAKVRLLSSSTPEYCIFRGGDAVDTEVRGHVIDLEHTPKPFLRVSKMVDGKPDLRLACREDIVLANSILEYSRSMARHYEPLYHEFKKMDWEAASKLAVNRLGFLCRHHREL